MLYLYGRQGRWSGALGWIFLVAGVAALTTGVSKSFAWGGLVFFSVTAFGLLLIIIDLAAYAKRR